MSLVIHRTSPSGLLLNDLVRVACINAYANENMYFKPANSNNFVKAAEEELMLLTTSDQLVIIFDENKDDTISTNATFKNYSDDGKDIRCDEILLKYGKVEVSKSKNCHMAKVSETSLLSELYGNNRYKNTFATPTADNLANVSYKSILSSSLKNIYSLLVKS